jgi:hypothetical protein
MWTALTCVAILSATLASPVLLAPNAVADPAQDQQYLGMVHGNGIGGQDGDLLAYAAAYCAGDEPDRKQAGMALMGEGVGTFNPGVFYALQTMASRTYCPNRIPIPSTPFPPLVPPRAWG